MPNGFQAPFAPVVTSLLEHLRPTDRSVAAAYLLSVTMPIRLAICWDPHSSWLKAVTMRTKPQWGPSSGSNSADFDAGNRRTPSLRGDACARSHLRDNVASLIIGRRQWPLNLSRKNDVNTANT